MIDFLGIGTQKSGTTWLYEHLRGHPDIRFPAGKEVHFWDWYRDRGVDWWTGLFPKAGGAICSGEFTPSYALLDARVIREIRDINPDLRLLISFRNPMQRTWSSALMALRRSILEFDEVSDQWFIDHFRSRGSLKRGDYVGCLKTWRSVFPADQFNVVWFDDIVSQPRAVLSSVAAHIGVDPGYFAGLAHEVINKPIYEGPHFSVRPHLLAVLQEIYRPKIDEMADYFKRDLSAWLDWDGVAETPSDAALRMAEQNQNW